LKLFLFDFPMIYVHEGGDGELDCKIRTYIACVVIRLLLSKSLDLNIFCAFCFRYYLLPSAVTIGQAFYCVWYLLL
jgi:hypothetical protein